MALDRGAIVETLAGGIRRARYPLEIGLADGSRTPGAFARSLQVPIDDGPPATTMVSRTFRAPLVCTPDRVHFGMLAPGGEPKVRRIAIRSSDGQPFRILSTTTDPPGSVGPTLREVAPGSPSIHVLEVTLGVPEATPGRALSGRARIATDLASFPELHNPWSASLKAGGGRRGDVLPEAVSTTNGR